MSSVRPGIWQAIFLEEDYDRNDSFNWQFDWISDGPLDIHDLPTRENCPRPSFREEDLSEWSDECSLSVDSGKFTLCCQDMMEEWVRILENEHWAIQVAQDPFRSRQGYQGVLPGGFFSEL